MSAAFSSADTGWPIQPDVHVHLGQHQPAGWVAEVAGQVLLGKDPAEHLVRAPAHGGDRGDAEALVDLGAARIVDPRHDVRDVERFAGHPGGQDVRVVAAGHGGEGVGLFDAGLLERFPVEADAGDLAAGETGPEPPEGTVVLVDDRDRMAGVLQGVRQGCPNTATTHDHEVRHTCLLKLLCLLLRKTLPATGVPEPVRGGAASRPAAGRLRRHDIASESD